MMKRIFILACSAAAISAIGLTSSADAQVGGEVVTAGGILPSNLSPSTDPADRLASSLRLLAQNPYDIGALTQAGESALAVGDANAAIGFLARAEGLSPASGRIKSSLASALVLVERPIEALRLFSEAISLGVPEYAIARDRGLAFDLTGDPKRAQRDYHMVLRGHSDDEVTRRLALSMGIAGEKDAALKQIEPLIRRRDQAAWRARAFILAMNGDMTGAERIAQQVVPANMMPSLASFMARLPRLTASQRAYAVNFGTIPSQQSGQYAVQSADPFRPIGENAAVGLTPPGPVSAPPAAAPLDRKAREKAEREARRRPGTDQVALATPPRPVVQPAPARQPAIAPAANAEASSPSWSDRPLTRRVGERIGPVDPARLPPEARPVSAAPNVAAVPPKPAVIFQQTTLTKLPEPTREDQVAAAQRVAPTPLPPAPIAAPPVVRVVAPTVQPAAPPPAPARFEIPASAPLPPVQTAVVQPPKLPNVVAPPSPTPTATLSVASPNTTPATVAVVAPPPVPAPAIVAAPAPVALPSVPAAPRIEPSLTPPVSPQIAAQVAPPPQAVAPARTVMGPPAPSAVPSPPSPGFSTSLTVPAPTPAPVVPSPVDPSSVQITPLPPSVTPTPISATQVVAASAPDPLPAAEASAARVIDKPELPPAAEPAKGLASILEGITPEEETNGGPVMSDIEFRKARLAAKRKAEAEALAAERGKTEELALADAKAKEKARLEAEEAEKRRLAAQTPERIWVQIATGSNRSGLAGTLKNVREKAPDALKGLSGATTPFKATHRVLVGPFKSQAEARTVVNKLGKQGVSATTFTSSAGQEVTKLSSR